jgi:hypothetical protein
MQSLGFETKNHMIYEMINKLEWVYILYVHYR